MVDVDGTTPLIGERRKVTVLDAFAVNRAFALTLMKRRNS